MNEKSWIFKRPSVVIACAIYLSAAILIVLGGAYYSYANTMLQEQRMDILDKTMQYVVQSIDEELQSLQSTALSIRLRLRYLSMPDRRVITAEERLEQHDASAQMKELLSSSSIVQQAYLYSSDAHYAITPNAVFETDDLTRFYQSGGFAPDEMDTLHATFSLGSLFCSENGCQMAYLLSIGKDSQTGMSRRQLVILLRRNFLQTLLSTIEIPVTDARYVLESPQGAILEQICRGEMDRAVHAFRYPLNNGCTLLVELDDTGLAHAASTTGRIYLAMILLSLLLITGIAVVTCRFSHIPIEQMIDYIRQNYSIRRNTQGDKLTVLRDAVEEILESQSNAEYQLLERDEEQRWERMIHSLQDESSDCHWEGRNYVLLLFTPHMMDYTALFSALEALQGQADAYAFLPVRDGITLLLGNRKRLIDPGEITPMAEGLLGELDNAGVVLRAAVSNCHTRLDELHIAYREGHMALDCLLDNSDAPVLCYQDCDFKTSSFCMDTEYLSRQQHFNRLVSQEKYDQAIQCLDSLVSDVYEDERISHSEMGKMYLEMIKYQMMSCIDYLYSDSSEAIDIRRNAIRELLLCTCTKQVTALMNRLLSEMAASEEKKEDESGDNTLIEIKKYIRQHYDHPQMSVTFLAEHFGMSPNNVSKLFSRKANMGVLQYIHKIRIENACNLMLNTDMTLSEISQHVGYTSNLTFNRAFKARYHMSPSDWKKLNETMNS